MYGAHSNSGHPFLISSDNLHDEVTKRSGRHDTSMAIIRYHMRPSDSEHVVPFPMQITGFYVFFTFLSFPVIFLALSFSPSVLLPLLSLFLPLSVCLCVCVSMQFPVIFFWFCSCFFQFISFSCTFLSFSLLSLLYLLSASLSLQTPH